MDNFSKEQEVAPPLAPPLDPALFQPSPAELEFLRKSISNDDDEIRNRLSEVQKESFETHAYPCIRLFHFTNLMMSTNPIYPKVVEAGKRGDTRFLDLGCCMGTDLRKLVLDGYPPTNVIGCDLRETFIEAGHKLFRDRDTCPIKFFTGDIFGLSPQLTKSPSTIDFNEMRSLEELKGRLTHVYSGAVFHLFDKEPQYAIARRLATLLREGAGGVIFGRQLGHENTKIMDDPTRGKRFEHNPETWKLMWHTVFAELKGDAFAASHVVVEATIAPFEFGNGTARDWLFWSVTVI